MLLLKRTAIWLAILPFCIATACTSSNAIAWPTSDDFSNNNSNFGSSGDACPGLCGNRIDCLDLCYGNPSMIGREIKERTTLSCTGSETCFSYTDGSFACIDLNTGSFRDDSGGSGNLETGEYTAASGQKTTVSAEGTASEGTASRTSRTADKTAISTSSHASNTKTETVASNTKTETVASTTKAGTVASITSTSATSTSISGAEKLSKHGSFAGILGLVAYLL